MGGGEGRGSSGERRRADTETAAGTLPPRGVGGGGGLLVPAMMSSVRLDAAALGALVHHLPGLELQAFDEFLGGVSFGHGSLSERRRQKHKEFPFLL